MSDASAREEQYFDRVCGCKASCAVSLLELWERPWSTSALRYANHALVRAYNTGLDVLEHDGIKGWIR